MFGKLTERCFDRRRKSGSQAGRFEGCPTVRIMTRSFENAPLRRCSTPLTDEYVLQDPQEPGANVASTFERVAEPKSTLDRIVDEILGLLPVTRQVNRSTRQIRKVGRDSQSYLVGHGSMRTSRRGMHRGRSRDRAKNSRACHVPTLFKVHANPLPVPTCQLLGRFRHEIATFVHESAGTPVGLEPHPRVKMTTKPARSHPRATRRQPVDNKAPNTSGKRPARSEASMPRSPCRCSQVSPQRPWRETAVWARSKISF